MNLRSVPHAAHVETFTSHGARRLTAETIAKRLADDVQAYIDSTACIGEHFADQLLLPMALAGGGSFTTITASDHLRSNAALIQKFWAVEIAWEQVDNASCKVVVSA